jgi:hypothetical protein
VNVLDPQRAVLADQRMKSAQQLTYAVYDKLTEVAEANRKSYETFYNQLVLISGGTVALSITYLGYLKTTQLFIVHARLLVTSWIALLFCLLLAVFANFFYSHYLIYANQKEYSKRKAEQFEIEAQELPFVPHAPPLTAAQLKQTCDKRREAAEKLRKDFDWNERRANFCWFIWKWGGLCARIALVVGILFLVLFAVVNLQNTPGAVIPFKKP